MPVYKIFYCLPSFGENYDYVDAVDEADALKTLGDYLEDKTGERPLPYGPYPGSLVISLAEPNDSAESESLIDEEEEALFEADDAAYRNLLFRESLE